MGIEVYFVLRIELWRYDAIYSIGPAFWLIHQVVNTHAGCDKSIEGLGTKYRLHRNVFSFFPFDAKYQCRNHCCLKEALMLIDASIQESFVDQHGYHFQSHSHTTQEIKQGDHDDFGYQQLQIQ